MAMTTVACSADAPVEQTPAYKEGLETGIAFYKDGGWPNLSRSKAEDECYFTAEIYGFAGAEGDDFIAGCVNGLLEH
ncbi:hypothetical protein [Streptomyces globisporus]|uniref:hypothetical protein n=1 Tax=Streptomyces globisporus TaxID=1908 RepID=UPI0004CA4898|nr:hypothetical protein [Streptomyces globisporus]